MEDLSDCFADIIEFPPHSQGITSAQFAEISTGTEPLPLMVDKSSETNKACDVNTQTQTSTLNSANCDDKKLAQWLKRICPFVESELSKENTPINLDGIFNSNEDEDKLKIQTYQKIFFPLRENFQGVATWLSIYTNNTPILVLTTCAVHNDWCEHIDQSIKVFVPKRSQSGTFVSFQEIKSIPTKACIATLSTNPFDKDLFVGSTVSGDLYVWRFISGKDQGDINELFCETLQNGNVVDFAWPEADRMLTCHINGLVSFWRIGQQLLKERDFLVKDKHHQVMELKKIVSVSATDFVVGCADGSLYHCVNANSVSNNADIEINDMRRHKFEITSLYKKDVLGRKTIISCDLSGEVFFHDLMCSDEDTPKVILRIPLPFQNSIACSNDGNLIFCPGIDGSLEIYRVNNGKQTSVKGALQGRGNMIQISDNGSWIVTGFFGGDFQIFHIQN